MFEQISVLIPFQSDNGVRDRNLKWVLDFYKETMPNIEICIGYSDTELFSRSLAINNAAKKATRPIYVLADGDLFFDPSILSESILHLDEHSLIVPYNQVKNIGEEESKKILNQKPTWPIKIKDVEIRTFSEKSVGGLTIVKAEDFKKVEGFDERFLGWGGEDTAFYVAISTLVGTYERLENSIYHLYHPRVGPQGNPNYQSNLKLTKQYLKNMGNRKAIKRLLKMQKNKTPK